MRRALTNDLLHVGIDPDLHSCAWAVVSTRFEAAGIVRVPKNLKGQEAVAAMIRELHDSLEGELLDLSQDPTDWGSITVEGQQIYRGEGATKNPASLLPVAVVAGAAALAALQAAPDAPLWIPLPREWKGNVPKKINQGRSWTALGVCYTVRGGKEPYCVPALPGVDIRPGDWKHAGDAVGLALAGKRRYEAQRTSR